MDLPGMTEDIVDVLRASAGAWSAVTLPQLKPVLIIHNPFHAPTRQESDLMHEMAHILCAHQSDLLTTIGGLPYRSFAPEQEEEATWLGAALQAPRTALLAMFGRGMTLAQVAKFLGCSEDLVRFRKNKTGIDRQLRGRRRRTKAQGARNL